jgi:hypothetical protein
MESYTILGVLKKILNISNEGIEECNERYKDCFENGSPIMCLYHAGARDTYKRIKEIAEGMIEEIENNKNNK